MMPLRGVDPAKFRTASIIMICLNSLHFSYFEAKLIFWHNQQAESKISEAKA